MKLFFTSLFLFIFFTSGAQAVGVAIDPAELDVIYHDKTSVNLKINNISLEPISVNVQADDLQEYISIQPNEFVLLPQEIMVINLALDFTDQNSGIQKTNISVISKALDKQSFNAASGIKIPLTVAIVAGAWQWNAGSIFLSVFAGLLFLALLVQAIIILSRPRKKHNFLALNFLWHHKKSKNFINKIFKK
jgi:hypothetical protein